MSVPVLASSSGALMGNSGTVSVTIPSGAALGSLMVVAMNSSGNSLATPPGWVNLGPIAGFSSWSAVFAKYVLPGDPNTTYSWGTNASQFEQIVTNWTGTNGVMPTFERSANMTPGVVGWSAAFGPPAAAQVDYDSVLMTVWAQEDSTPGYSSSVTAIGGTLIANQSSGGGYPVGLAASYQTVPARTVASPVTAQCYSGTADTQGSIQIRIPTLVPARGRRGVNEPLHGRRGRGVLTSF